MTTPSTADTQQVHMKVTKAQTQANRAHVVEAASTLFRERGYDGVGIADLMGAAGLTHGGFYKLFGSKVDLMAQSAATGIAQTVALSVGANARDFVRAYVSRTHRDDRASGCTMAALGGDAARQPEIVRETFAAGIEGLLAELGRVATASGGASSKQVRASSLDMLAHAVGAIVLSRACPDDSPLADEILNVSRDAILETLKQPAKPPATARAPARKRSAAVQQAPRQRQRAGDKPEASKPGQ